MLEAEHQLRGLLRVPVSDGTRLVPVDVPTLADYRPDWLVAVNQALAVRPELVLARNDLKFRQLDLLNQKNLLLPDLRFTSTYDINGLGSHLDGGSNDPNNAFHSLATDRFNNWSLGLNLNVPIGFRDAHSAVRAARLNLARSYGVLQDQELKTRRQVAQQYRLLSTDYHQIEMLRAEREADARWVDAQLKLFLAGRGTLDFLLEAQRSWSAALSSEYGAIATYNNTLVRFAFATGTIMERDNVVIGEGPLPGCAQMRAVEHERERAKALLLLERADPVTSSSQNCEGHTIGGLPVLPSTTAPSIPALFEGRDTPPAISDPLPMPRVSTRSGAPAPR